VQEKLNEPDNRITLRVETKMQKRVKKNYPSGTERVQSRFKVQSLNRVNNFKPEFLRNKDERLAKDSMPLSGYIT
jgi:hypothetical protein